MKRPTTKKQALKVLLGWIQRLEKENTKIGTSTIRFLDMKVQNEYDKVSDFKDVLEEMTEKEWQEVRSRLERRIKALKNSNPLF